MNIKKANREIIKGNNVLITGATGGIGSKAARILSASEANLFIAARNKEKLQSLAREINIGSDQFFALDISKPEEVAALKEQFFSKYDSIDVLLNAAGIGIIKSTGEQTDKEFLNTINCNLFGPFLLMKAFLPKMKETKKGLVINIPGILGKAPMAGAAAYSASEYGLKE